MSRATFVEENGIGYLRFDCPAENCGAHQVSVRGTNARWSWNGSIDRPTLAPSIRVSSVRSDGKYECHSQVTDGRIFFYPDTTHALAGQTVDLPKIGD